jgi:hypothetical protein
MRTAQLWPFAIALAVPLLALGQTSSERIEGHPRAEYSAVKETVNELFDTGIVQAEEGYSDLSDANTSDDKDNQDWTSELCSDGRPCGNRIDLVDCTWGRDYLPETDDDANDPAIVRLADIAYEQVRLTRMLSMAGYPRAVWQPLLERREGELLRRLDDKARTVDFDPEEVDDEEAFLQQLSTTVNAYRNSHESSLSETMLEGGCGDASVGIHIATDPVGGRTRFVSVFEYILCKRQGIDPNDETTCDRWREPVDGILFEVAGDYHYKVDWPGGQNKAGIIRLMNMLDGETATIRR